MNYLISLTSIVAKPLQRAYVALLCLISLGFAPVFAADFGEAVWGMAPAEIRALESRLNLTPIGEQEYLIYRADVPGIEQSRIVYQFQDQLLVEGRFVFTTADPLNIQLAVDQYDQILTLMNSQYGPSVTEQVLTNPSAEAQPASTDYATELAADRLILKSSWRSSNATVLHQLAWQLTQPNHQLIYRPSAALPEPALDDVY
jgi:hypothetical protein